MLPWMFLRHLLVHTCVHFWWEHLWECHCWVGFCSALNNTAGQFSKVVASIYIPTRGVWKYISLFSPRWGVFSLFYFSHSIRHVPDFDCGFDCISLMLTEVEHLFIYLWIIYLCFVKSLRKSLANVPLGCLIIIIIDIVLLICQSSYISDISSLLDTGYVLWIFSLNGLMMPFF